MDSAHPTGSKRQLTPTPQNGPHLWKSCVCISYNLALVPPCIYLKILIVKKMQHNFLKMRGVEGCLEFFRKFIRFGAAILPLSTKNQTRPHTNLIGQCLPIFKPNRQKHKPTIYMILFCVQPLVIAAIWWSSLWTQMFLFHEMFHLLKCTMQQIKSTFARRASLTISRYSTLYLSNFKETTKLFLILQFHFVRAFLLKLVEPP